MQTESPKEEILLVFLANMVQNILPLCDIARVVISQNKVESLIGSLPKVEQLVVSAAVIAEILIEALQLNEQMIKAKPQ